jgi:hypothetical protein
MQKAKKVIADNKLQMQKYFSAEFHIFNSITFWPKSQAENFGRNRLLKWTLEASSKK